MHVVIAPARAADLDAVLGVLREARAWQRSSGVDVWQDFDAGLIAAQIRAGRVFVAALDARLCGTITLLESDALVWGADGVPAFYVHKLAARRDAGARGVGARLLGWAAQEGHRRGKRCLRLDTWDGNRKMRAYYENQGFRHVRDVSFAADSPLPADYRGTAKSLYQKDMD